MGPGDRLGDPNLSSKFQTVSIIEVELFGKLYYTPTDGLIGVKLFSSEAGNANNYKESLKGILDFLSSVGYSDQIREPMSINDKRSSEQNDSHKKLINGEYTITEGFFNDEKSIDLVFTLTKVNLKLMFYFTIQANQMEGKFPSLFTIVKILITSNILRELKKIYQATLVRIKKFIFLIKITLLIH